MAPAYADHALYLANGYLRLTGDGRLLLPRGPAIPDPSFFAPPEGVTLLQKGDPVVSGVGTGRYSGTVGSARVTIDRELFLSMTDPRLISQRLTFTADADCRAAFTAGVGTAAASGAFARFRLRGDETALCVEADLPKGETAAAAARFPIPIAGDPGDGRAVFTVELRAGEPLTLDFIGAVATGPKDADPARAALEMTRRAPGRDWLMTSQRRLYGEKFILTRMTLKNAPEIERALDTARYHMIAAAPGTDESVPAPGADAFDPGKEPWFLAGQSFPAMTFYLLNLPKAAERILRYWTASALAAGDGAPLDRAACIAGELSRYALYTGDTSLLRGGGAGVIGRTAERIHALYSGAAASPFPHARAVLLAAADLRSVYGTCSPEDADRYRALAAAWEKDPGAPPAADTPEDQAGALYDGLMTKVLGLTVTAEGPDFSGTVPPPWGEMCLPVTIRGKTYRVRLT